MPTGPAPQPRRGSVRRQDPAPSLRGAPWRAVLVLVTLVVAAWIAVPPFAGWWTQRAEIQQVRAEAAADNRESAQLRKERDRLNDDAQVRQEARTRLDYAEPGEKRYHVLTEEQAARESAPGQDPAGEDLAWYETVWGSVEDAAAGVAEKDGSPVEPEREADRTSTDGASSTDEPVREVEEPVPSGVPSLITEDDFDPKDIPRSDLEAGEEMPAAEGDQ